MPNNRKFVVMLCPSCFSKETDIMLAYDELEDEYYCKRCAYSGKEVEIREAYTNFCKFKYKEMK